MKRNDIRRRKRIFQKSICLLLSMAMLLTGSVSVFAADPGGNAGSEQRAEAARSVRFSDTAGHWAAEYIGEGVEKSWINGYPNGTFRPQNTITRAEFVKLILSAMKLTPGSENAKYLDALELMTKDDKPYDVTPLSDVKAHWVTTGGYMDIALKYGMVINAEYSGEKFQPDKAITRREIAVMAMRALGLVYPSKTTKEKSNYSDATDYPDWLQGYLTMTEKTGVIEGYPDGSFRGENTATRAEALTIVSRVMEEMEQSIDDSAEIYATVKRYNSDEEREYWKEPVPQELSVPLLKIGRVFYADGRDLYKISEKNCTNGVGDSLNPIRKIRWWPEEQKMRYAIDWHTTEYTAGNSQMRDIVVNSEDWGTDIYDIAAPKMLYGHLMIPVYDEMRAREVSDIEGKSYNIEAWTEWRTICEEGNRLTMYVNSQYRRIS